MNTDRDEVRPVMINSPSLSKGSEMFKTVAIKSITIPEKRRRQVSGIEDLAAAIREAGRLINPITVTDGMVLSAGYRRLLACKLLGWEEIPAHVITEAELDSSLVEIAENLHRQELSALDRAEQTAEWKAAFLAKHPEAGHGKTAGAGRGKGKKSYKEPEFGSLQSEMKKATGRSKSSVKADCQIAENIPQETRDLLRDTPIAEKQSELLKLARMDTGTQKAVADKIASGEGKNVRHAHKLCQGDELRAKPAPLPTGPFDVIAIDPPWEYRNRPDDATQRGAVNYQTMPKEQLLSLPVATLAGEDCILWLWSTNSHMQDAFALLDAWGFTHKTILTWGKNRMGVGDWLRGQTEHCLMGVRGKPVVQLTNQTTLLHGAVREHSRKPEEFYQLVESLCPGSKCELSSRMPRAGWIQHGNQFDMFVEKAAG